MALDSLATAADLAARNITVGDSEGFAAGLFLRTASAVIRDAAGCPISRMTSTIELPGVHSTRFRLPSGPVTSVTSVLIDDVAITGWKLIPGDDVLYYRHGWQRHHHDPSVVTITYVHGLVEVPEDIVDLVCRMATSGLVAMRSESDGSGLAASPGIVQERIDDYSVTYSSETQTTEMELSERLRDRIASRFGAGIGLVAL